MRKKDKQLVSADLIGVKTSESTLMEANASSDDISSGKIKKKIKSVRKMPQDYLKRDSI